MKNFCITFFVLLIIMATAVIALNLSPKEADATAEYVRIHVRANSNDKDDQDVKYLVKDGVVAYLTPLLCDMETRDRALACVKENLPEIERVCEGVLREHGYFYGAKARLKDEAFPTRVYGDLTLYEGIYTALIVELGEGVGDNWWCVLYPPLCFTGGEVVSYRSLILDIIHKFR